MLIHRSDRYTISAEGGLAVKTGADGKRRTMKYCPERDAAALAGEISELTAWRIFADISRQASESGTPVSPEHILIDGPGFCLAEWSASLDARFIAPEGYSAVWALGASVFFIYLGCYVFQELGGKGQTATAPVPVLRSSMPELSALVSRCLDFEPSRRPLLSEITEIAETNIKRCLAVQSEFPPMKTVAQEAEADDGWPEEMI